MASSKVNVKFVVILSSALLLVFAAVAFTFVTVFMKSPAENARMGDKYFAQGDYVNAEKFYGKAVFEERTNIEYLTKYRQALEAYATDNRTDYEVRFNRYVGVLRDLARAKRTDLAAHTDYLEFFYTQHRYGGDRSWSALAEAANTAISYFENSEGTEWQRLLRYRGLATLADLRLKPQFDPRAADSATEDLTLALQADPADHDSLMGLVEIDFYKAREALARNQADAARAAAQDAIDRTEAFARANPRHPMGVLTVMQVASDGTLRRALGLSEQPAQEEQEEQFARAADLLREAEPNSLDGFDVRHVRVMERLASRRRSAPVTIELTERLLSARPDDPDLLLYRAELLEESNQLAEAIAALQKIVDLPARKMSLLGMLLFELRDEAVNRQSAIAYSLWERTDPADGGREALVAQMRKYHDALAARLPSDAPVLLLTEARVLFTSNRLSDARLRLVKYVDEGKRDDPQALWMLARIAQANANWSEQAERLERLVSADPDNVLAAIMLADVYASGLRKEREARAIYEKLLPFVPEGSEQRAELERKIGLLAGLMGESTPGLDPVDTAITRAFRAYNGSAEVPGDSEEALQILTAALEPTGYHPRVVQAMAQIFVLRGEIPLAGQIISEGLKRHPTDPSLERLRPVVDAKDQVELMDAIIAASPDEQFSPGRKALARYEARVRADRADEARPFLEEARRLLPEDPAVIEAVFRDAISRDDEATARAMVDLAVKGNIDSLEGLTFQARLEMFRGRDREALDLLQRALARRPDHVSLLRLTAAHQIAMGLGNEAVETYRRGMELRGTDANLISEFVNALVSLGRGAEALAVLKESAPAVAGRRDLIELRLDLEADVGDRNVAIERRRQILSQEPNNRTNKIKLARLYTDATRFADARLLIDQLRDASDDLTLVNLDASWHGAQGDLAGGVRVYQTYIGQLIQKNGPEKMTADPYLSLGVFLLRHDQTADGVEALRTARRWEDPATMRIEKSLGEALRVNGRYEEAAESFTRIVDAGKDDPSSSFRKRLIDSLIRAGKASDAMRHLEALAPLEASDSTVLMLRADALEAQGDLRGAREVLDRAVRNFSQTASLYARRAQLLTSHGDAGGEQARRDALEDLNTAVNYDPSNAVIRRMRGQLLLSMDDLDAALNDLSEAVRLNPSDDGLVQGVLIELIRADRSTAAVSLADEVVKARPSDPRLLTQIGSVFAMHQEWNRAERYFSGAWARTKDKTTGNAYATVLLRMTPPRFVEAREVLASLAAQVDNDWSLLMSRAEVLLNLDQADAARRDAVRAFRLVQAEAQTLTAWFNRAQGVFDEPGTLVPLLDMVAGEAQQPEYITLFRADALAQSDQTWPTARQMLDGLIANSQDTNIKRFAYQSKSRELLKRNQATEAVDVWKEAVEVFSDDWQMLNNLAYTLCNDLNRCSEAVAYARRAADLVPTVGRADVLDTLGWTLAQSGELTESEMALEQALAIVGRGRSRPVILLHLAYVDVEQGRKDVALRRLDAVSRLGREGLALPNQYETLRTQVTNRANTN